MSGRGGARRGVPTTPRRWPGRPDLWALLFAVAGGCDSDDLCTVGAVAEDGRLAGMLRAHNMVRARVTDPEPSPDLDDLRWSESLAATATCWARDLAARGCPLDHSSGPYGENLAWFSGQEVTPERVVSAWAQERNCYSFGTFMGDDQCSSDCDDSGGCGHYTQLVWRDSTEVGCGVADCEDGSEIWVCNYDPPGNFVGQEPY